MQLKLLKQTGFCLILIGFTLFILIFFSGKFILSESAIDKLVSSELQDEFKAEYFNSIEENKYNNPFSFIHSLEEVFQKINEKKKEQFKIKDQDLELFWKTFQARRIKKWNNRIVEEVFSEDNSIDQFKLKMWLSFGGWLDGRSYDSKGSFLENFQLVASNINTSILDKKGFNKEQIKKLKYNFIRSSTNGLIKTHSWILILLTYGFVIFGSFLYFLPEIKSHPGIKNDGIFYSKLKNKGWIGIFLGFFLISFYIILYFFPWYMVNWIVMLDPISTFLGGETASQWFLYGFLYTISVLVMGVRMIIKYRHTNYQLVRTASVMFFQLCFAFLIPEILKNLNKPSFDFKNMWPLDYSFFFEYRIDNLIQSGHLGIFMLVWGISLFILGVPILVYFFGKRWYCSWVCGCGGLAETLGDPFRQLSNKSLKAWKIERWTVHSVLIFVVFMTIGVLYTYFTEKSQILGIDTYQVREVYGFSIGTVFAGVVGTGFYPLMGNRVWCRFGCPLAAYLGIVQRFKSRFRITTNGGQCISCGNCSTYCEMGIDVRWYAQRGQNIVRASCVGCGVCASVCPRGVLNLENKPTSERINEPLVIGNNSIKVNQ